MTTRCREEKRCVRVNLNIFSLRTFVRLMNGYRESTHCMFCQSVRSLFTQSVSVDVQSLWGASPISCIISG